MARVANSERNASPPSRDTFHELVERLEALLTGDARQEVVAACLKRRGAPRGASGRCADSALSLLRREFARDSLPGPHGGQGLSGLIAELERQTQADGFHILRDWDGRARRFVSDPVSVAMLDFAARMHSATAADPRAQQYAAEAGIAGPEISRSLALLVDHFVLFVIALLVMRAWDGDQPEADLACIQRLIDELQGPDGSGHRFVAGPESLMWIAVSNYHPDDDAYNRLLDKVRGLDATWQLRFATNGAHVLGTHLRWGLEAYYKRDFDLLRRDNVADYPWLLYSVSTVMARYDELVAGGAGAASRGAESSSAAPEALDSLALALLNGLTADPPGLTFEVPPALEPHAEERATFVERFSAHRAELLERFAQFRPDESQYSPVAFHFNFPHNAMKAALAMRLAGISVPDLPLDALFEAPAAHPAEGLAGLGPTGEAGAGGRDGLILRYAQALDAYSRANPETIRDRRVMVLAYNVAAGLRMYRAATLAEPVVRPPFERQ